VPTAAPAATTVIIVIVVAIPAPTAPTIIVVAVAMFLEPFLARFQTGQIILAIGLGPLVHRGRSRRHPPRRQSIEPHQLHGSIG